MQHLNINIEISLEQKTLQVLTDLIRPSGKAEAQPEPFAISIEEELDPAYAYTNARARGVSAIKLKEVLYHFGIASVADCPADLTAALAKAINRL